MVENVGLYTFVIEGCVEIQYGQQYNCATSQTFTVEIMDSCLKTEIVQIVSTPIFKTMQAAQLYTDDLNLVDDMTLSGWRWTDTLSLQLGEPNKCGELTYSVVNFNGTPQDLVTIYMDPVDVTLDYLLFAPTLEHPVGTYFLSLRAELYYGPSNTMVDRRDEPFTVVINNCFAFLDLSLVTMPELQNIWYKDMAVYDISYVFEQVVPSVECGWPYGFDVVQVYTDEFGNEIEDALPLEINFVKDTNTQYLGLDIAKCNPIGVDSPVDIVCNDGTIPH